MKQRLYEILELAKPGDRVSRFVDWFLILLILANVAALVLGTVERIERAAPAFFRWFEIVSVAIFSVEYALRLWVCTEESRHSRMVTGRLRYAIRPLSIVDLVAILPFFLPMFAPDLRAVRVLRVMRLLRLAKLGRYSRAMQLLGRVIVAKRPE